MDDTKRQPQALLTDAQRRTTGTAITILATVVIAAAALLLFWLLVTFFATFTNVFLPLAVAAILALILKPYQELLCRRVHVGGGVAVALVFASIIVPLALLLWAGGALLYDQLAGLVDGLPKWWDTLKQTAPERYPQMAQLWEKYGLGQRINEYITLYGKQMIDTLSGIGSAMYAAGAGTIDRVAGMLGWLVLPVYLAFLLRMPTPSIDKLEDAMPFLKTDTRKDVTYLVREFVTILITFFRGQLLIAVIQGALFAIGFGLIGLSYGVILGFVLGCLNIVPYLGSMLTLVIALPLALFQQGGGWMLFGLVLMVFTAVQMIEQYVLTPRIMGDRTGLHPLVIIVAIFFWGTALNGIMGMILAIPLTAFFAVLWRLVKAKYIREII